MLKPVVGDVAEDVRDAMQLIAELADDPPALRAWVEAGRARCLPSRALDSRRTRPRLEPVDEAAQQGVIDIRSRLRNSQQ